MSNSTTTHRFDQDNGDAVYVSTHTDYDGNETVLMEHHSGTRLVGTVRLTQGQAQELKAALEGWGY